MDIKKDTQSGISPVRGRDGSQRFPAPNGMESFSVSLGKKCERLATALYLVTGFLSDTEPLKSRLRALSLDFVRDASYVRYGTISVETNVLDTLRANISETIVLLELALIAGLVSEMNFSILKREYADLRSAIDVKKTSRESRTDTILGETFFGSSFINSMTENPKSPLDLSSSSKGREEVPDASSKGHFIRQKDTKMSNRKKTIMQLQGQVTKSPNPTHMTKFPRVGLSSIITVAQEARRTRITKLVKDNREVTIKDIATYFPELSEKTIQRELVVLVELNVLKKSGERRWSRYALA